MENTDTIGRILKAGRDGRGLSLDDVHDATKITPQNISALEEDRFEYFPNRVYARAFLRDYANYLDLDSADLLARYEQQWNPDQQVPAVPAPRGSFWRPVGYVLLALVVTAALGAGGYYASRAYQKKTAQPVVTSKSSSPDGDGATLPTVKIPDAQPEPTKPAVKPGTKPVPTPAPTPVREKLSLSVAALQGVWIRVTVDGAVQFMGNLAQGQAKSFEGKKINVRAGMAGAVRVTVNGKPETLGSLKEIGDKTYFTPNAPKPESAAPGPVPNAPPAVPE